MKNSIREFIEGIPEFVEGMSTQDHHRELKIYLEEELPRDMFDAANEVSEFVSNSYLNPKAWLTFSINKILQGENLNSKFANLFYFFENFYFTCIKYSSVKQAEELFIEAIEYSSQTTEIQDLLLGVYPEYDEYIEEI